MEWGCYCGSGGKGGREAEAHPDPSLCGCEIPSDEGTARDHLLGHITGCHSPSIDGAGGSKTQNCLPWAHTPGFEMKRIWFCKAQSPVMKVPSPVPGSPQSSGQGYF